ncbi:MAG: FAD binding domain-containing protein, partial [Candidatus Cloacimonetes bacterium]|nr:FAD binding domain-containing protein [Candidatus Cloacimonadota bacterium]
NIANASPIGDTLPLLLALDASLELFSAAGERSIPLSEFYLEYKKTDLKPGEIIKSVLVPVPPRGAYVRSIKAAKRKAVDISSVVTAVVIETEGGKVTTARLAAGGVAAVPKLSLQFRKAMQNMELQCLHPQEIAVYVAAEFEPITDVRGSKEYRSKLVYNHVYAYLREFLDGRQG